jgi:hypothetical protein
VGRPGAGTGDGRAAVELTVPRCLPECWPLPRGDRGVKVSTAPPRPIVTTPRTHVIPFSLRTNGGGRSTGSTAALRGPAAVTWCEYKSNVNSDPPTTSFELGWSTVPVNEDNISNAVPLPYNRLFTRVVGGPQLSGWGGDGLPFWSVQEGQSRSLVYLGLLIVAPEFHLCLSYRQQTDGGADRRCVGWVNLVEGINPMAVEAFR